MWTKTLNLKSDSYLLEDDGYRFWVTYLDGPAVNVPKNERMLLMEYKQFDFPGIARDIVEAIHEALELPKAEE